MEIGKKIAYTLIAFFISFPLFSQKAFVKSGKWGYKSEQGKVIVEPIYEQAKDFSEGLGNVKRMGWWGYVNRFGKCIIPFSFDESYSHKDGLAGARKDYTWGFIDRVGNTVIPFEYSLVKNFSENMAAVKKDGYWGYIDKKGLTVIPFEYDDAHSFSEGLAAVKFGDKWGYIDTYGIRVIEPQYEQAGMFGSGYAAVKQNGLWGYIDVDGKVVIDFAYSDVSVFENGVATVWINGKAKAIDMKGTLYKNLKEARKKAPKVTTKNYVASASRSQNYTRKTYGNVQPVTGVGDSFSAFAKNYVEAKVAVWQKKDEFEKTSDYQKRVNETTRNAKIKEYTEEAKKLYIKKHSSTLVVSGVLGDYDADNEVFMVRERHFGNLLVKVPLNEAKDFKSAWDMVKTEPTYGVANDKLALEKVVFTIPSGKKYTYDNDEALNFSIAQIDYNFAPIEISSQVKSSPIAQQSVSYKTVTVGKSDVDVEIPQCKSISSNTFAVIIANENYQSEANVDFALNDGAVFAEYCNKVLGLPKENIQIKNNATLNNMRSAISWLQQVTDAYNGEASVIFYYAGHGIPNEATGQASLLPIDGESTNIMTAYSLDDLYKTLGNFKVKDIKVFLDACFSGSQRGDEMLASARATVIKPRACEPRGRMIVFSATHGEQTAFPYKEQFHGMFTYFLLKKLKESKGDVTMGELSEYVKSEVSKRSVVVNKKSQTPTIRPAYNMRESWATLKLREDK